MNIWKTLPFTTAILVAQSGMPPVSPPLNPNRNAAPMAQQQVVPLYNLTVVQGSAKAINYRNLKNTTEIDLLGTVLVANASGIAKVRSEDGTIHITASFKNLPPASSFGGEFLTYVLWGISPEGSATNLGEVLLEQGKGKIKVTEKLQTFGLIVTAEPYFAVNRPSDVVVMENAIRQGSTEQFEYIDAKYELLKRGQYSMDLGAMPPMTTDAKTPSDVIQARNAVRIARASGAPAYAPDAFGKAEGYLAQAEMKEGGRKARTISAREAIQRAEDARQIALQKQDGERLDTERQASHDQIDQSKRETARASAATDAALLKTSQAESENAGLRSQNDGLQTKNDDLQTRNEGLRANNDVMRSRLREELNAVLNTRATARGLIVNMSDVMFENGQATLLPTAREKLSKIAGILSAHRGLKIEAEGFTDSNGGDALNQRLSEERASNTKDYLVKEGVNPTSITFQGFGNNNPIATNDTAAGRQENRRVELVVSGEGLVLPKPAAP